MLVYLNIASDPQYTLTVSKAGTGTGKVVTASLPGGIDCGSDCSEAINSGLEVSLSAIPDPGSAFSGWSVDATGTANPLTLTMDGNKNVTATFTAGPSVILTSPNGGETWQRGQTQTITWNYSGNPGTHVRIQAMKGTRLVNVAFRTPIGANGSGSFNWRIPRFFALTGTDIKLKITSTTNTAVTDTSDNVFTLNP
jgi:hypothetical protein